MSENILTKCYDIYTNCLPFLCVCVCVGQNLKKKMSCNPTFDLENSQNDIDITLSKLLSTNDVIIGKS